MPSTPIPSLQVKMKQAPVVCEVIPGGLQPRLVVIPDLIRNLAFTTPVTWVRLEILKQLQDNKVGGEKTIAMLKV